MIDQIKTLTRNYKKYLEASKAARRVAEGRWLELEDNIDKNAELYTHPYKAPERIKLNSLEENR